MELLLLPIAGFLEVWLALFPLGVLEEVPVFCPSISDYVTGDLLVAGVFAYKPRSGIFACLLTNSDDICSFISSVRLGFGDIIVGLFDRL